MNISSRLYLPLLVFLLLVTSSVPAKAQSTLKDLFDTNSFGYARVNIQDVELTAAIGMLNRIFGEETRVSQIAGQLEPGYASILESLRDAGATDAWYILSLTDALSGSPCFFIGAPDANSRDKVIGVLQPLLTESLTCHKTNDGVVISQPGIIDRLAKKQLPLRDDIDSVLACHGNADIAAVLAPSAEHLKVMREVFSTLPAPFEEFTGSMLADGGSVVTLRISPQSDLPIELNVGGLDTDSNQRLFKAISSLLEGVASNRVQLPYLEHISKFTGLNTGKLVQDMNLDRLVIGNTVRVTDKQFALRFSKTDGSFDRLCETMSASTRMLENAGSQMERSNWLRQCVLACHNYHDAYKSLPAKALYDEKGNALLSWRVMILPFVEENALYQKFRLDEPWDSEHNKKLIPLMPRIYVTEAGLAKDGKTTFVMATGDAAAGQKDPLRLQDFKDGTSRTILMLDVAPESAVIWTKPDDWEFDADNPLRGLFIDGQTQLRAGFADGSIQSLPRDAELIKARLTVDGGEIMD